MNKSLCAALAGVVIALPLAAQAADFDGSKALICATQEAHDCDAGEACVRGLPQSVGAPQFMRIDFAKKAVVGPKRTAPIANIDKGKDQLILQGTELDFGWTLVIDSTSGEMTAAMISRSTAVMLFGACTPQ